MTKKILIIEDYPATAQMISEVLEMEGYNPILAPDGQSGIEIARAIRPALILLDVMLPGMNGIEVCRCLKGDPATSEIPIIIVSVKDSAEDKQTGIEAGCSDYIVKPFELEEMIETIKKRLL